MSESVNIMNENTKDKLEFPIYGSFTSKRKIRYSFCIYEDGTVAQWQRKRKDNGLKHVVQSNDYDILIRRRADIFAYENCHCIYILRMLYFTCLMRPRDGVTVS